MSNTQEAITRLATQLQMVYRDFEEANQSRYRMKSQIILTNLQPDTPVSSLRIKPLIQFHRLNEPSQVLAPVFMHIIKTQWPMLMLNRGLTASFTTDTQFAEFIERHSGSIWQFTVGRHPELPNNPTQWWKLEHFPAPELLPDDVYEDAISEGIIEFVNLRLDEDDDDDDVPPTVYTSEENPCAREHDANDICCICISGGNIIPMTVCGHSFHQACIQQWLRTGRKDCPTCRRNLFD